MLRRAIFQKIKDWLFAGMAGGALIARDATAQSEKNDPIEKSPRLSSAEAFLDSETYLRLKLLLRRSFPLECYADLKKYKGDATGISIVEAGQSGFFLRQPLHQSVKLKEDGGTVCIDALGRYWLRQASGPFNVLWWGADPLGISDSSEAINKCFQSATRANTIVYFPSGSYLCEKTLVFGSQSSVKQSDSPCGLLGDGWSTSIVAGKALQGTLLQSNTVAGVRFEDFQIDCRDSDSVAWDCSWKAGSGPSAQCKIKNIRVLGGSSGMHVNLDNLNDSFPEGLVVIGTNSKQVGISMRQSGGLVAIYNSTWHQCFLRFGSQNGSIINCWGEGIEFSSSSINNICLIGDYIYCNPEKGHAIWSESFESFQSIRSLNAIATQFISNKSTESYFNINIYSTVDFSGCQWVGPGIKIFGKNCRADTFSPAEICFRGGLLPGWLDINSPSSFNIKTEGLVDERVARTRKI